MLAYDYDGQSSFDRFPGFTAAIVFRAEVDSGNSSGWSPLFGGSLAGPGLVIRDNYSYPYINFRFGSGSTLNQSLSAQPTTAVFDQNHPNVLLARIALNKSLYSINLDWNINNNQFTHTYSSTYNGSQNTLLGMILGANYVYKTSTQRFHGEIGEFLFFDSMLNNKSANTIGNYLATKWGQNWSDL